MVQTQGVTIEVGDFMRDRQDDYGGTVTEIDQESGLVTLQMGAPTFEFGEGGQLLRNYVRVRPADELIFDPYSPKGPGPEDAPAPVVHDVVPLQTEGVLPSGDGLVGPPPEQHAGPVA